MHPTVPAPRTPAWPRDDTGGGRYPGQRAAAGGQRGARSGRSAGLRRRPGRPAPGRPASRRPAAGRRRWSPGPAIALTPVRRAGLGPDHAGAGGGAGGAAEPLGQRAGPAGHRQAAEDRRPAPGACRRAASASRSVSSDGLIRLRRDRPLPSARTISSAGRPSSAEHGVHRGGAARRTRPARRGPARPAGPAPRRPRCRSRLSMNSTSRIIGGDCTLPSSVPATVGSALAVGPGPALGPPPARFRPARCPSTRPRRAGRAPWRTPARPRGPAAA